LRGVSQVSQKEVENFPFPQLSTNALTVACIAGGGGGGAMGALLAGITPIWSIDFDPNKPELSFALADSYEQNFNGLVIRQTIQEVAARGFADLPRPDFLLITLSCSHFAACRSSGVAEDEGDINAAIASGQAIRELQPLGVVIENVPLWKGSESYSILIHTLECSGYEYTVEVLKASDYGVPQERERLIIRALKGASVPPMRVPTPAPSWYEAIADLIGDLPPCDLLPDQKKVLEAFLDTKEAVLVERTGYRNSKPKVRLSSQPCFTIKAAIGTDGKRSNRNKCLNIVLPGGDVRRLTPRAIARLQSFPDAYKLPNQIKDAGPLLGLAIPPLLAKSIFESFRGAVMEMKSDLKTLQVLAARTKINRTHLEIEEGGEELVKEEDGEGFSPLPHQCAPVDPELESLIPPLSQEQYKAIEASISRDGCRDPIVFWKEKGIIIDGHHRFSICRRNNLEFPLVELSFPDKEAVKAWIAENQLLLRRNANDPTTWYLRGVWYEAHRNTHGGDRKSQSKPHNEVLISPKSTSELGAEKFGVSPTTIERDAQYKRAVDAICCLQQRWATPRNASAIASVGGVQIRTLLLSGEIELKKTELIALGKQVHLCPEAVALKLGIAPDLLGNSNQKNSLLDSTKGANDSPSIEEPTESHSDLALAHHLKLSQGGLVEIDAPAKKLLHGRYGRIESVGEKTAQVWVWSAIERCSKLHTLPHRQLTPVPLEKEPQLKDVCDRISRLYQQGGLEPIERDILGLLEREVAYSPTQLDYLAGIEAKYLPQSSSNASNPGEPIATSPVVEVIELPFLPPTLNEIIDTARSDKYAAAKQKRRWTNEVADACQGSHQFKGQVRLDYLWRVKNTKRDPNNVSAGTKFIDDGLVAAKIITDDSLEVIVSVSHRYEKADCDSVKITITEVK
jgi:DNA (cytosine-5)-methyltransferase 1